MENSLQIYSYSAAVISGILFWAGFLVFGFIAKRYHVVFDRSTFHTVLMAAPSGILIYALLLVFRASFFIKDPEAGAALQMAAYIFLFVSAALCLAGIVRFKTLVDELMKYKGGKNE